MYEEDLFTIQVNEKHFQLMKLALAISYLQLQGNETDFSRTVNDLFFFDVDDLTRLRGKIEGHRKSTVLSLDKEELLLLYTCHYVTNCFFREDAFWKWYYEFSDDNQHRNAEEFREINITGQWAAAMIIEESEQWDEDFGLRKSALANVLGNISNTMEM